MVQWNKNRPDPPSQWAFFLLLLLPLKPPGRYTIGTSTPSSGVCIRSSITSPFLAPCLRSLKDLIKSLRVYDVIFSKISRNRYVSKVGHEKKTW